MRTYIQSGNVLFSADDACARRMPRFVEEQIERRFGFRPPVILRTAREIKRLIDANPFVRNVAAANALYVAFLSSKPTAAQIASLDANRSPGDSFIVVGREIFMNLAANGAARTKLTTAYFDAKLDTVSTVRNWRTTLTILEMMDPAR